MAHELVLRRPETSATREGIVRNMTQKKEATDLLFFYNFVNVYCIINRNVYLIINRNVYFTTTFNVVPLLSFTMFRPFCLPLIRCPAAL